MKDRIEYRYRVIFCRKTHVSSPAETIIKSLKPMADDEVKKKFHSYFTKNVFDFVSCSELPKAVNINYNKPRL